MGNVSGVETLGSVSNSKGTAQVDAWKEMKLKFLNYNILVLGATEAGKSTLVTQLRRFSGITKKLSGIQFYRSVKDNLCFSQKELNSYLQFIQQNIFTTTKDCLTIMKVKNLCFDLEENQVNNLKTY